MLLTAKRNIPINSAYLARPVKNCLAESYFASQLTIEEGGLYVFLDTGNLVIPRLFSNASDICRSFIRGIVCTSAWNTIETKKIEGQFSALKQPMPNYLLGEEVSFKSTGKSKIYKIDGWSTSESWGTWTIV